MMVFAVNGRGDYALMLRDHLRAGGFWLHVFQAT